MAQASDRARGMFRYDPSTGMFTADLAQGTAAAADEVPAPPDDYLAPPHAPESHAATPAEGHPRGEAVEGSVAQQLREAMLTAQRLAATPLDNAALLSLEDLLQTLTGEADLLDDAALKDRIASAQPLLMRLRDERSAAVAEELAQLFAPPEQPAVRLSAPLPATQAAADEELSQIFVEEAQENLDAIDEQLLVLRQAPDDLATMTTLRRAFHTLKGSSRMVGLRQFGDGAWAVEQCFNMWLAQERPASDDLLRLGAAAAALMRGWIARIAQEGAVALQIAPLVQAAQRVREGGAFTLEDDLPEQPPGPDTVPKAAGSSAEAAQAGLPSITTGSAEAAPPPAPGLFGVPDDLGDGDEFFPELDDPLPTADAAGDTTASDEPGSEPPRARVIALPLDGPTRAPAAEETRRIGPLEVSHGLYSVFLNEADECIRVLAQDIAEWRFEPARSALPGTLRRAHSLAGIWIDRPRWPDPDARAVRHAGVRGREDARHAAPVCRGRLPQPGAGTVSRVAHLARPDPGTQRRRRSGGQHRVRRRRADSCSGRITHRTRADGRSVGRNRQRRGTRAGRNRHAGGGPRLIGGSRRGTRRHCERGGRAGPGSRSAPARRGHRVAAPAAGAQRRDRRNLHGQRVHARGLGRCPAGRHVGRSGQRTSPR